MTGSVLLLAAAALLCPGDTTQDCTIRVPRTTGAPSLSDWLAVPRNAQGVAINNFRQRDPGDGVPVSQETTAYLSYDDENLYVVFVARDEPGMVRAHMVRREDISLDDQVVVYLDTFQDRRRAYRFAANPLGVQLDGIVTEGQEDDTSFDTYWHSRGELTPDGFVVTMTIPFRSLRFSNAPAQTWGIALGRMIPRNNEESYWPHITKRVEGFVQQFATLEGLRDISPGRNLQVLPYAVFAGARFLDTDAPTFVTDDEARAGLDAKVVVKDALTFDFTLNPDFSQVESDEPQVTVNQRFEVFFPEKRPFFIENAGFFQTPMNLFFSRRLADPQLGARVTGKIGGWMIAGLVGDDREPGGVAHDDGPLVGRRARSQVIRVQRELAEGSGLGLVVTNREFATSSNRVFSLDTRLKLGSNWIVTGQMARALTTELDGTARSGNAYFADLERQGRHLRYAGRFDELSADFRADLGFVRRVDLRQTEHEVKYRWRPENGPVVKFGPTLGGLVNWNGAGQRQDWSLEVGFDLDLTRSTALEIAHGVGRERFDDQDFGKHRTTVAASTQWLEWLWLETSFGWGTTVNFDPAPGLRPSLANEIEAELRFGVSPTPRFRVEPVYIYDRLGTRDDGAKIFENHIGRLRLNYQFGRELSLRTILDYEAVLPDPALVSLEREERLSVDIVLTYLLNPGTAVYLGYIDNYENLAFALRDRSRLRRTDSLSTSTGRQLFVKASYLLNF